MGLFRPPVSREQQPTPRNVDNHIVSCEPFPTYHEILVDRGHNEQHVAVDSSLDLEVSADDGVYGLLRSPVVSAHHFWLGYFHSLCAQDLFHPSCEFLVNYQITVCSRVV